MTRTPSLGASGPDVSWQQPTAMSLQKCTPPQSGGLRRLPLRGGRVAKQIGRLTPQWPAHLEAAGIRGTNIWEPMNAGENLPLSISLVKASRPTGSGVRRKKVSKYWSTALVYVSGKPRIAAVTPAR